MPRVEAGQIVFVYGTLKRGGRWHHLLGDAELLGGARTLAPHPLIVDDFPYLLDEPGRGLIVEGELYRVNSRTLARLDELEGHPHEYHRRRLPVRAGDGEPCEAWAYFLSDPVIIARVKEKGIAPIAVFDARNGGAHLSF